MSEFRHHHTVHSNTSHLQATRATAAAVHPTVPACVGARWPTGAIFELILLSAPDAQTYCALVQACRGFRDAVHAGFAAALPWARRAELLKILRTRLIPPTPSPTCTMRDMPTYYRATRVGVGVAIYPASTLNWHSSTSKSNHFVRAPSYQYLQV